MTRVVVVGAGSAGCVVAARLSARSDLQVTLLEAGPPASAADAPKLTSSDFFAAIGTSHVWPHLPATDRARTSDEPPERNYLRGRGVGGSSLVNAMVALEPEALPVPVPPTTPPHLLPVNPAAPDQLGAVDRALLSAEPQAGPAPLTMVGGRRVSSAEAYLAPIADRPNLAVRTNAAVDRVRRVGVRPRAVGVVLESGEELPADRVVLCAGAIHTPAILLRSNIAVGVAGSGLRDHPSLPYALALVPGEQSPAHPALAAGVLAAADDLQLLSLNHLGAPGTAERGLGMVMPALMRPRGFGGAVRLDPSRSGDPAAPPLIEFDLVGDPHDLARLVAASQWTERVLGHEAFTSIVEAVYIDAFGTTVAAIADDETRRRWVRSAVGDYVHATSTCAIGRVVDTSGAVFDHDALYVCDASIFPTIPDVNTHLPVTMLAEALCAAWLGDEAGSGIRSGRATPSSTR